jgi:small GTP-binding protein
MIQKKICMVGTFGVGKTSLVERFVEGRFSDSYLTTLGVKISRKPLTLDGQEMKLILWDLAGEDKLTRVDPMQLRGAAGYFLVADGTRASTLEALVELQQRVQEILGPVPFTCVVNKLDLRDQWQVDEAALAQVAQRGWPCRLTSARSGEAVEELFLDLAQRMRDGREGHG